MSERSIPLGAFVVAVGVALVLLIIVLTSGGGAGGILGGSLDSSSAISAPEIKKLATQMKTCDETIGVIQGLAKRSATAGGSAKADELLAADTRLEATCAQLRSTIERLSANSG